jgi:hypothetical protein
MEDFEITEIQGVQITPDANFWSLLLNFKFASVGGCQAQIKDGDSVLWALIPLEGPPGTSDVSISERLAHSGV